jgi:beta-lactamase class A
MRKLFFLFLTSFFVVALSAQKTDKKLFIKVQALIKDFHGDIGIYIKDLNTKKIVAFNADTIFPTASIIKLPILIGVMNKINKGELMYHQRLVYKDSLVYAGEDLLASFKNNETIELSKLMMLMLTMSDNTASLWLQTLAGTGTEINRLLDSIGFQSTRINSRTPGREKERQLYGWGQSTPKEIATIFERIDRREIVSKSASDKMLRLLNRSYFDEVALSQLPPYATVFTKYGAVDRSRNEAALVKGKKANYVFCIMTKNNHDTSWAKTNEAWELTRKLSSMLWHYFERKDSWQRSIDADKFD